jgi:hypothetical protein
MMKRADFKIGAEFWCGGQQWRCTDIAIRTIVAIRLDQVEVGGNQPELRRTLNRAKAKVEGWFNGPPCAVNESVFDEYDMEGCSPAPKECA